MTRTSIRSAASTGPSLMHQLNESSPSSEDEFVRVTDPEKKEKRILTAYLRLVLRVTFLIRAAQMQKVGGSWRDQGLKDEIPQEQIFQERPPASTKKKRRDDLTGVGAPVAPTGRKYSTCRSVCTHEDTLGQTSLQAQGGQMKCPTRKILIPMHLWVCRLCGARWMRIAAASGTQGTLPKASGSALQPQPTPISGLRTRVKREAKDQERPHPPGVDEVMIHSDQEFEPGLMRQL